MGKRLAGLTTRDFTTAGFPTALLPLNATAADVIFDGSFSADGMGRPLTKYVWDQPSTSDVVLSAAISAANAANSPRLVIPGASLVKLPVNLPYTLRLTVTNFLSITASGQTTFTKLPSGALPVVTVLGGLQQSFTLAGGIKVSAQLLPSSVCSNKQVGQTLHPRGDLPVWRMRHLVWWHASCCTFISGC